MEVNQLFYAWVPKHVRYAILLLLSFVNLCANGVYLGITTNMYSDLGVYAEPYTMATNALYIGMGSGMIFLIRLAVRFSAKTLILAGLLLMLLMNLICATTSNPAIAIAATLILGFSKMLALGQVYLAWSAIWSKTLDAARVYPFFYFVALAGIYFITWMTTYFTYLYSWRYAYVIIFMLLVLSIALALLFFENHPLKKKIPLYQLDIPGLLLLILLLMLINYIAVYGKVEDWFNSNAITAALFSAFITLFVFIKRESSIKRPLLDLSLFRKFNVSAGLFLFLVMGVLTPTTFQTALSGNILHFELLRNAEINLFLIPGIFAGSLLTFFWYQKKFDGQLLIIMGFAALVLYHILIYTQFVNDLNIDNFLVPSFLRGFGLAVLYISIGLYTIANLPIPATLKAVGLVLIVRSFLATGLASGLSNYFLYAGTTQHLGNLASAIDANEPLLAPQAGSTNYYKYILQQANLSALKELSGNIIIFGLVVVILLVVVLLLRKMNNRPSLVEKPV